MRNPRAGTIYDALRIPVSQNGALQSPTPQSERPIAAQSFYAGEDSSGIGQASTTARHSRTYTGADFMPQGYLMRQPAGFEDVALDAGAQMNARAAHPSRGLSPGEIDTGGRITRADPRRRSTPLAKRR